MGFKKKFIKASDFQTITNRPASTRLKKDLLRIAHDIDRHPASEKEYLDVMKEFLSQFTGKPKTTQSKAAKNESEDSGDSE